MERVFIGKVVNTHGIKGEFRIKSDFELKSRVFVVGKSVLIDGVSYKINSYRIHKGYDMITVDGLNDINDVIPFKTKSVFVDREILELKDNEYLNQDLIGKKVCCGDVELGEIIDYTPGINPLLKVKGEKTFYIPLNGDFILKYDKSVEALIVNESAKELII